VFLGSCHYEALVWFTPTLNDRLLNSPESGSGTFKILDRLYHYKSEVIRVMHRLDRVPFHESAGRTHAQSDVAVL
jgi:hypothetical protein